MGSHCGPFSLVSWFETKQQGPQMRPLLFARRESARVVDR